MDPITTGALIGAGSSLLGGAFSNFSNKSSAKKAIKFQENLARYGIRWRVKDAKAAGLHPLYALGANIPQSSPVVVQDSIGPAIASAGQDIGRAVAATQTPAEKLERELALKLTLSQLAESDARKEMYLSAAARDRQAANAAQTFPVDFGSIEGLTGQSSPMLLHDDGSRANFLDPFSGVFERKPNQIPSTMGDNPGVAAGKFPFFSQYQLDPNTTAYLPYSTEGPAESVSEIPMWMWPGIIKYNAKHLSSSEFQALSEFLGFPSVDAMKSWASSAWESLTSGFTKK